MQIETITISVANTKTKKFAFTNLISSEDHNTKGKTSLIRFLIWGLGFNVALTNKFKSLYSETLITFADSVLKDINRRGNVVKITTSNGEKNLAFQMKKMI